MTPESVFAKSPKGIEEIVTRAHKLGSRLRQVLIRVDGVKTLDELAAEAGDSAEALVGQVEELQRQGFLTDTTLAEETVEPTAPQPAPQRPAAMAPAPPAPTAAPKPSPAPAVAAKPTPGPAPLVAPEAVEFNSPVKFRLQDLLVEAMGIETGNVGAALNRCRNREDLARWVDLATAPIEQAAGKAKAKAFHKQARKLVGG